MGKFAPAGYTPLVCRRRVPEPTEIHVQKVFKKPVPTVIGPPATPAPVGRRPHPVLPFGLTAIAGESVPNQHLYPGNPDGWPPVASPSAAGLGR